MNDLIKRLLQYVFIVVVLVISVLIQGCGEPVDVARDDYTPEPGTRQSDNVRHLIWRLDKIESKIDALATKDLR